jgi:hypothetical protein
MNPQLMIGWRDKAALLYQRAVGKLVKARVIFGLFLLAAVCLAIHTSLTKKDASLHLKLQHDFRNAQVSVWVDDDLAYAGKITGSTRKKFGLIPTDSVQGNLSQILPVRVGQHHIRLRIEPDDAAMQEDSISGEFSAHIERDLVVSARHNGLSLSWQGSRNVTVEAPANFGWIVPYAGSLLLTIAGSVMSALVGYAIKELPSRLRSASDCASNTETRAPIGVPTD